MFSDSVMGAVYLSIVDMIFLIIFLYIIGLVLRLFPLVDKLTYVKDEVEKW